MTSKVYSGKAICIAGSPGSGKTTLSVGLCSRLGGSLVSFGDFVRLEARQRSLRLDRPSLQELGTSLLASLGPEQFVKTSMVCNDPVNTSWTVFDGVRHVSIWTAISSLFESAYLVYLRVRPETIRTRLQFRDGLEEQDHARVGFHPMEREALQLEQLCHLLLDEKPVGQLIAEVLITIGMEESERPRL